MNKLLASQVIKANNRVTAALEGGGGGEVWENVPIRQHDPYNNAYVAYPVSNIVGRVVRVTYEIFVNGTIRGSAKSQPVTKSVHGGEGENDVYVPINNINIAGVYTGVLAIDKLNRAYINYGVELPDENVRPKILKIERLVENE